jgi:probable HAF family extracellular repeat protein
LIRGQLAELRRRGTPADVLVNVTNDGWFWGSGMLDLGTLGGSYSWAYGVNDAGQVVGESYLAGNLELHAFVWSATTGMVDLGTLGGTASGGRVNNLGQVTGVSFLTGDDSLSRLPLDAWWRRQTDLGTLGGDSSEGTGINDSGQVVGWASHSRHMRSSARFRAPAPPDDQSRPLGGTPPAAATPSTTPVRSWGGRKPQHNSTRCDLERRGRISSPFRAGHGLWALRHTAWLPVHAASPKAMVSGDFDGNGLDDLAIDFSSLGVWLYMNQATWLSLHASSPTLMAVGDLDNSGRDDLMLSFRLWHLGMEE